MSISSSIPWLRREPTGTVNVLVCELDVMLVGCDAAFKPEVYSFFSFS